MNFITCSTTKATAVEDSATTIKLWPKYASTTAATRAIDAEITLEVEWKTSGKVMEVRTANGM